MLSFYHLFCFFSCCDLYYVFGLRGSFVSQAAAPKASSSSSGVEH